MKYCDKCGNELFDEAVICPKCGCPVVNRKNKNTAKKQGKGNAGANAAAIVFLVIGVVILLAVCLPFFLSVL